MINLSKAVNIPIIRDYIKEHIINNYKIKSTKDIIVPSIGRHSFEGTCFDYCLRILLAKEFYNHIDKEIFFNWIAFKGLALLDYNDYNKWNKYTKRAKEVVEDFISGKDISLEKIAILSQYLSNLDIKYRADVFAQNFVDNQQLTEELVHLMKIIPMKDFSNSFNGSYVLLNPVLTLKQNGLELRADADIIMGNSLIDIKTTLKHIMSINYLYQLAGYASLMRYSGVKGLDYDTNVENIGIYFSRHGVLEMYNIYNIYKDTDNFLDGLFDRLLSLEEVKN